MSSSANANPSPNANANPLVTTYNATPLVTRLIVTSAFVTYISSIFFLDVAPFVSSSVDKTLFSFQVHRLLLSPLVCTTLLSLVFTTLRFMDSGKRIEHSIGSTNFAFLLISFGILTNVLHILTCLALYKTVEGGDGVGGNGNGGESASGNDQGGGDGNGDGDGEGEEYFSFLMSQSVGVWNLVLAMTAAEFSTAEASSQTRLFLFTIPTRYYPLFLLFINGISIPHCISLALGYLSGGGKLDVLKLTVDARRRLEHGILLRSFTSMDGFVPGPSSSSSSMAGTSTWRIVYPSTSADDGMNGYGLFNSGGPAAMMRQNANLNDSSGNIMQSNDGGYTPTLFRKPPSHAHQDTNIPLGGGHRLGNATLRSSASNSNSGSNNENRNRAADRNMLLAAAERRAAGASTISTSTSGTASASFHNSSNPHDEEKGER